MEKKKSEVENGWKRPMQKQNETHKKNHKGWRRKRLCCFGELKEVIKLKLGKDHRDEGGKTETVS